MRRTVAGLTLIEVLIALAIISIALTGIIKATSQTIRDTTYLQNKMVATWVGETIMNDIRTGSVRFNNHDMSGEINQLNHDWYWLALNESTLNKRINKITVSVYAHEMQREEKRSPLIQLESYIYNDN